MSNHKKLLWLLITFNLVFAFFIGITEYKTGQALCILGKGCKTVQESAYGSILGIKLSILGILAFIALFFVYYLVNKDILPYWTFVLPTYFGTLSAIYFIYLQIFVIKALCSTCIIIDSVMIVIGITTFVDMLQNNK